jgi:hypothetical protein
LSSNPALIGMTMFIIYVQALKVSYVRLASQRDRKGPGEPIAMPTSIAGSLPELG